MTVQSEDTGSLERRRYASDSWLIFAVVSTVVVLVVGSSLLLGFFIGSTPEPDISLALPAEDSLTVVIGRAPGGATQWAMYTKALRAMEDTSGMAVRTRYIARRAKVFDALQQGDVDIAFVSVSEYLRVRDTERYEILAAPVIKGQRMEAGAVVVETGSPSTILEDLRGARVALSSGSSLGGYGYLFWLMEQSDEVAEEYFSSLVFNDSHAEALDRLITGGVDAAVVGRSELAGWPEGRFRVISESPEFGMRPVIVRAGLDDEIKSRLQEALLQLGSGTQGLGDESTVEGFHVPSPEDYAFAETLMHFTDPTLPDGSWNQP